MCLNHFVQVADVSINTTSGASRPVSSVQRVSVSAFGDQGRIGSFQISKTDQIHWTTSIYQPSHPAVSNRCSNLLSVLRLSNNAMSPHLARFGVDVLIIVKEHLSMNSRCSYQSTLNLPSNFLARWELHRIRMTVPGLSAAIHDPGHFQLKQQTRQGDHGS